MLDEAVISCKVRKGGWGMPSSMRYEYYQEEISEWPRDREGRFMRLCRDTRRAFLGLKQDLNRRLGVCMSLLLDDVFLTLHWYLVVEWVWYSWFCAMLSSWWRAGYDMSVS